MDKKNGIIAIFFFILAIFLIIGGVTWNLSSKSGNTTGVNAGVGFTFTVIGAIIGFIVGFSVAHL